MASIVQVPGEFAVKYLDNTRGSYPLIHLLIPKGIYVVYPCKGVYLKESPIGGSSQSETVPIGVKKGAGSKSILGID